MAERNILSRENLDAVAGGRIAYADKMMLPDKDRPQWFCVMRDSSGEGRLWARSERHAKAMARMAVKRSTAQ